MREGVFTLRQPAWLSEGWCQHHAPAHTASFVSGSRTFYTLLVMSPADRRILDCFAARVREVAPSVAIWAFGSRARGSADSESDFDVCLVLPEVTRALRERIYEIAWEIGFDEGCVLSPLLLSEDDFERKPLSASTLVAQIRREGIAA